MREIKINMYLAALNAAYSMLGFKDKYAAKIVTLEPIEEFSFIKTLGEYPNLSSVNVHSMTTILREACSDLINRGTDENYLCIHSYKNSNNKCIFELCIIKNEQTNFKTNI